MVQNKKFVDELKKYNTALEKHFTNLDFDSLSQFSEGTGNLSENSEFYSIIATSIMDTKTEMALLRKNLSIEIEGMTKRMIVEQQNNFLEQMNKFYGKTIFELKENLNAHVLEINSNVSELKRDINNFSKKNNDFSNTLESFSVDLKELKESLISIKEISTRNNNQSELLSRLNYFEDKIDNVLNQITKKNNFIESNVLGLNKKLVKIENEFFETEKTLLNEKSLFEIEVNRNKTSFENVENKIMEIETLLFELENKSLNESTKLNELEIENFEKKKNLLIDETALVKPKFSKNKRILSSIENKLASVNNSLLGLESNSNITNQIKGNNNFKLTNKNKIVSKQKEIKANASSLNSKEKENPMLQVKTEVLSKHNIKNFPEIKIENKIQNSKMDSKIQKILEIDKRLEKLESLR